jgi:hypothetical protein
VSFWATLGAAERAALISVATRATFAAGERLVQEGDSADHVIVILEGWTEVCVDENGWERIIAERGPGQLLGERGGLQVRMRSASVIAVEPVRALIVCTEDFSAFLNAHPAVFDIVESQLYDRLTEIPVPYRSGQHPRPLSGENCTVLLTDVVAFGSPVRTDEDRLIIRKALLQMTHMALRGIPDVRSEDRGDGLLTVIPPSVPTASIIERLLEELPSALDWHNRMHRDSARIQLRAAVDVGPVTSDTMGVSGQAIITAARLVDAPAFKDAMANSRASLGLIASLFVYDTVIKHRAGPGYSQVQVQVKETAITAWMRLFYAPLQLTGQPGKGFPQIGLRGGFPGLGKREPAQRRAVVFSARRRRGPCCHEVAEVRMLMRGFALSRGDVDDHYVPDLGVRPQGEVGQAGLLGGFAQGDGNRVALPRVAVPAHLQPGLLPLMPAQQNPSRLRVHDQGGRGDV